MQGRPTEAMKESRPLQYGEVDSKDYIAGAEVLKVEEEETKGVESDMKGWFSFS